jgi:hypothetical protein
MAQPEDPIDILLTDLHQQVGNLLTLINIIRQLKRSQKQLLPALRTMMEELCVEIAAMAPQLPAEEGERHV